MACGGAVERWGGLRGGGLCVGLGWRRLAGKRLGPRDHLLDQPFEAHAPAIASEHAVQVVVAHVVLARECRLGLPEARHCRLETLPSVCIG